MKQAEIYQTKDKLIFCSKAKTVDGIGISTAPYLHLPKNAETEEIVSALIEVLDASRTGLPHPQQSEWPKIMKQHLEGLQMKTMAVLHNKALYCSVTDDLGELRFDPTRNAGPKGGYEFFPDTYLVVSRHSEPSSIAETLNEAFEISTQLSE